MIKPEFSYYSNGQIQYEYYYLNNKLHRVDGPAYISYYQDGKIYSEHYFLNGKHHREDGPAFIRYYQDGKIAAEHYYLDDSFLTKEKFKNKNGKKDHCQVNHDLEESKLWQLLKPRIMADECPCGIKRVVCPYHS